MPLEPEEDLVKHLASNVSRLRQGRNLWAGPVRPTGQGVPTEAVFVFPSGGESPEGFIGELTKIHRPFILIIVRGEKENFDEGLALTRAIRDATHYAEITGYIDWRVLSVEANYAGTDEPRNPEWTITAQPWFRE